MQHRADISMLFNGELGPGNVTFHYIRFLLDIIVTQTLLDFLSIYYVFSFILNVASKLNILTCIVNLKAWAQLIMMSYIE